MLSLSLPGPPASAEELAGALRTALAPLVSIPPKIETDGEWPALRRLAIDLSGARILGSALPRPRNAENEASAFSAEHLELKGQPICYESAEANLNLEASGARFSLGAAAGAEIALGLSSVDSGCFSLSIAHAELEKLILEVARRVTRAQDIKIERVRLEVAPAGPRAVSFRARVIAHKLFMSTALSLAGRLSVDEALVAHLADLSCGATGMIGSLACGFLQPHLDRVAARAFPLAAFALGETRVKDLQIDPAEPLRITASFGH